MGNVQNAYENIESKPVEVQLLYAAEYGDTSRLAYLLQNFHDAGVLDIDTAKFSLWTPLFMAAKQGHADCVNMLLRAGAMVDGVKQDNSGWTPLWVATYAGHEDCVRLLVQEGANLEAKYPETAVFIAAREGRKGCLKLLLDGGASVHVKDKQLQTPLHVAAMESNIDCMQLLILAGADLESRDINGKTPLICVCESADAKCLELLLSYGANPNSVATGGQMPGYYPMHICASKSKLRCLQVLWKFGAGAQVEANMIRPCDLAVTKEVKEYLDALEIKVRTLKDLSRLAVRKSLKLERIAELQKLYKLPDVLVNYLKFKL